MIQQAKAMVASGVSQRAAASRMGVSATTILRWLNGPPMTPVPHGTRGGYTNHRCRCTLCRAAQAMYVADYKAQHFVGPCRTPGCSRKASKAACTGYCYLCSRQRREGA